MTEREIFDQALQISDAAERARFVEQACGTNQAMAQRVAELLSAHEAAGSFLESPAGIAKDKSPTEELSQSADTAAGIGSAIGDLVAGKYKLLQIIGEGGMGVVYMAEQRSPIVRRVALKIIKPGLHSAEVLARFEA